MSNLVEFEDLNLLDGGDLRAVFSQVDEPQVLHALVGASAFLRRTLLTKLTPTLAAKLEGGLDALEPVPFEAVRSAQRSVVDALCRLGRSGIIAFDDPEDMVA